jgi:hypothetical protein
MSYCDDVVIMMTRKSEREEENRTLGDRAYLPNKL